MNLLPFAFALLALFSQRYAALEATAPGGLTPVGAEALEVGAGIAGRGSPSTHQVATELIRMQFKAFPL
jgi:hypothetical protein